MVASVSNEPQILWQENLPVTVCALDLHSHRGGIEKKYPAVLRRSQLRRWRERHQELTKAFWRHGGGRK